MISAGQIKHIRSLQQGKFRKEHGLFIAEGPRIVEELPGSAIEVIAVYGLADWVTGNSGKFKAMRAEVNEISQKELGRISNMVTPNQVLAVCRIPQMQVSDIPPGSSLLALDGIRDPGNMGTIIRTADWFGFQNIICSSDCVDIYNPKVIQSTMGSFARVKVFYTDLPAYLSAADQAVYAMVMDGENVHEANPGKGIYVIGNEAGGIRPEVLQHATQKLSIPAHGRAESLNAAVAAGIVMAFVSNKF